jgi:hypothetical protein
MLMIRSHRQGANGPGLDLVARGLAWGGSLVLHQADRLTATTTF